MKEYSIYELSQRQQYMMQMRPLLRKHAMFSDGTRDYRNPPEPDVNEMVTIRFRTSKDNVDVVWLCTGDKKAAMKKEETEGPFDYYQIQVQLGEIGRAHV